MRTLKETCIQIRVSEEEKVILKALAEQKGMTLSDFIRMLCKRAVNDNMSYGGNCEEETIKNTPQTYIDLREKKLTLLGGAQVGYLYKTTLENKAILESVAKVNNNTVGTMLRTLILAWLKAKEINDEAGIGGISITPRKRGVNNSVGISITMSQNDREVILTHLGKSGHKLAALIDTLIDTYVKPQYDELKGEQ